MTLTLMSGSDASQLLSTTSLRLIGCSIRRRQNRADLSRLYPWRPTTSTKRVRFTREIYEKYESRTGTDPPRTDFYGATLKSQLEIQLPPRPISCTQYLKASQSLREPLLAPQHLNPLDVAFTKVQPCNKARQTLYKS